MLILPIRFFTYKKDIKKAVFQHLSTCFFHIIYLKFISKIPILLLLSTFNYFYEK